MYMFKTERYLELLDGRTVEWLSHEIGYSNMSLYALFNGRRACKKALAIAICAVLGKDSVYDYFYAYDDIKE